jgi:TonB family protein
LPGEFTGPYLSLRFRFYYNPDKSELDDSMDKTPPEPAHTNETSAPSKSGVTVIISSLGDIYVPAGEWKVVTATVTGTKEQTVEWVTGSGCSPHCGHMTGDLYFAPTVRPSPPIVTLTATSKADPTAKAAVNVHIVEPSSNSTVLRVEAPRRGLEPADGIFHVGGGVSPPRQIYAPEPELSEEARKANYQGVCTLGLIVGTDGLPSNIRVLSSLGMGLDEKAIEAVKMWKFEPAMKDGHPVRVEITVDVSFHLDQKNEHPK